MNEIFDEYAKKRLAMSSPWDDPITRACSQMMGSEHRWRPTDDYREDERTYSEPETTPIPEFSEPGVTEDGNPQEIPPPDQPEE